MSLKPLSNVSLGLVALGVVLLGSLGCGGGTGGPAEEIDAEVMAALAEHYPDDQAVAFAEGDLRGWFWIEAMPGETEIEATEM